jgi:hypothetical protein
MRKERVQKRSNGNQIKMDDFNEDMEPLKSKLRKLEESMQKRLDDQTAYS